MKKLICAVLVLFALLGCMTACNFTQNASGPLAGKAESATKAEEMMTALTENRIADAKALLHPQASENSDAAISQMSAYLAGRKANSIEQRSIHVNTSSGTSGKTRQEQVSYQVTLSDGAVIYLSVVHLSDNTGTGFTSFQLVLGIV